jgi:glycosyltransferase involved in cell wall biosynthesis
VDTTPAQTPGAIALAPAGAAAAAPPVSPAVRSGLFIVIAAYNEARAIANVVSELLAQYPNVVVVDDGSADDTAACAATTGAIVLRHMLNRGQGAALQTGISYALRHGAQYVVTFDADGQHSPADLPAMLAPIVAGEVDICLGSRFLGHSTAMPLTRRLMLKGAVIFTRITSGVRLTDTHNGLRAFSRRAAQQIDIRLDRMAHASELIDQVRNSDLPYREVPVHIRYTDYSLAKGQRSTAALRVALDYLIGRLLR